MVTFAEPQIGLVVEFVGGLVRLKNPPVLLLVADNDDGCDCGIVGTVGVAGKVVVELDVIGWLLSLPLVV